MLHTVQVQLPLVRKPQPCHSKLSLHRWRDERPVDSIATEPNTAGPHAAMDKIKQVGTADGVQRVACSLCDGVRAGLGTARLSGEAELGAGDVAALARAGDCSGAGADWLWLWL